jgi:hypothetical protein
MELKVNIKWFVSAMIVVFLLLIVLNHFFKDLFKLNPYYRNKILLEGFDASGNTTTIAGPASASGPTEIPDTEKSTIMVDLFEKVNRHMDIIRTLKLSDIFVPINIDKTASEPYVIIANLKLLINNGIYKNEMDLKELYNKYIGNKAIQVLTSDINSVNMDSANSSIGSLETSFLTRCQSIVAAHQTIIDKILDNKSKE